MRYSVVSTPNPEKSGNSQINLNELPRRASELLPDAEATEDSIQQIVGEYGTDEFAELIECESQFQSEQLLRIVKQHDLVRLPQMRGDSQLTERRAGFLPDSQHSVRIECSVDTDDRYIFNQYLSDHHAIERVFVVSGKGRLPFGIFDCDGQDLEFQVRNGSFEPDSVRHRKSDFPLSIFDGKLPDRRGTQQSIVQRVLHSRKCVRAQPGRFFDRPE